MCMCYAELRANIDVSFRKSNKKEKKSEVFFEKLSFHRAFYAH